MVLEAAAQALEKVGAERVARPGYKVRGVHLDALLAPAKVRAFAQAIRSLGFLIEDVTAVDATPDLMLVYHFAHPDECCRVIGRTLVSRESPAVASIHDIFPGANWHERETHDFYGVVFEGHPDLSPLILPEDSGDLRPLRKAEGELKALGAVVPEFAPATEGQVPRAPGMERERPPPKAEGEAAEAEKPVRPKRERPAPATEGQVPRAQDAQERSKAEGEA